MWYLMLLPLALGQPLTYIPPQAPTLIQPAPEILRPIRPVTPNPFGQMDPMMMMLMLDKDSSSNDLLPLMMMNPQFQQGGMNGQMNPLMWITLLDKTDCALTTTSKFAKLSLSDQQKIAKGEYFYLGTNEATVTALSDAAFNTYTQIAAKELSADEVAQADEHLDYKYMHCLAAQDNSKFKDILPLMLMGQNQFNTMDPMMMMLMLDDTSNDMSLFSLMALQGQNVPGQTPNPLLWMTLLDDDKLTKLQCDTKYDLDYAFKVVQKSAKADKFTLSKVTAAADIRAIFESLDATVVVTISSVDTNKDLRPTTKNDAWAKLYDKCVSDATSEGTSESNFDKLLPLLMMQGQGGMAMDPMMMMLLMK